MDSNVVLGSQYNRQVSKNSGPELVAYYTTGEITNGYDLATDPFIKSLPSTYLLVFILFSTEAGYSTTAGVITAQGANRAYYENYLTGANSPWVTSAIKLLQFNTGVAAGSPGPTYAVGWAKVSDITAAACKFPNASDTGNRSYYQVAMFAFKPSTGKSITSVIGVEGSNFLQNKYIGDVVANSNYSESDTTVSVPIGNVPSDYSALRMLGFLASDHAAGAAIQGPDRDTQIEFVATINAKTTIVPLSATPAIIFPNNPPRAISTSDGAGIISYTYNDKNTRNIRRFNATINGWRKTAQVDAWAMFGMMILIKEA